MSEERRAGGAVSEGKHTPDLIEAAKAASRLLDDLIRPNLSRSSADVYYDAVRTQSTLRAAIARAEDAPSDAARLPSAQE